MIYQRSGPMECSGFQFCTLSLRFGLCVGGRFNARSTLFNSQRDIRTRNLIILLQNMNTDLKQIAVCSIFNNVYKYT